MDGIRTVRNGTENLTLDAVIATRNRTDALALSIPLLLGQSRPPERLIVIDSSDDHRQTAEVVAEAVRGWPGRVILEHSDPGLPLQRNSGLRHVTAPIVLFPDDDSLFCPDALEKILRIYERDQESRIVGVAARETDRPPEGCLAEDSYQRSRTHQRQAALAPLRYRLERRFLAANPFRDLGLYLMQRHALPGWLGEQNAVPIEFMTGFRMSFRTEVIRRIGFDETLVGHALGEDIDASFAVAREGLLIGARSAEVFHHKFPSGRGNGYMQGAVGVLNRTYILCKHMADGQVTDAERRQFLKRLSTYIWLRFGAALPRGWHPEGFGRIKGILAAMAPARRLRKVPRADLARRYSQEREALDI